MTDTETGYGSVKTRDRGERIYVEPSCMDTGGVYLDMGTQSVWLSEKQAKKLRKLLKEAIKAGLVDG